jgi:hypothetical protein
MTPAAADALHAMYEAARLLVEHELDREAVRLRYHARVLEAELLADRPAADGLLTDDQIAMLMESAFPRTKCSPAYLTFARIIERASRGTP